MKLPFRTQKKLPTPSFELGTDRAVISSDGHEIAQPNMTQRGNRFDKQAGRKRLTARVEFNVGPQCHVATLSRHFRKIQARQRIRLTCALQLRTQPDRSKSVVGHSGWFCRVADMSVIVTPLQL